MRTFVLKNAKRFPYPLAFKNTLQNHKRVTTG